MFVDREAELHFLDGILTRGRPGPAQLVLLYGRRRVGKIMAQPAAVTLVDLDTLEAGLQPPLTG